MTPVVVSFCILLIGQLPFKAPVCRTVCDLYLLFYPECISLCLIKKNRDTVLVEIGVAYVLLSVPKLNPAKRSFNQCRFNQNTK